MVGVIMGYVLEVLVVILVSSIVFCIVELGKLIYLNVAKGWMKIVVFLATCICICLALSVYYLIF